MKFEVHTKSTGLTINKYTCIYRYILGRKISPSTGMWKKSIHSKDTYNVGGKWSNTVMIPPHGLVDVFRLYGRRDFQGTSYPTLWIKTRTEYYIQIVLAIHFHLDSQWHSYISRVEDKFPRYPYAFKLHNIELRGSEKSRYIKPKETVVAWGTFS